MQLDRTATLDSTAIERFRSNGHVTLRGLLDPAELRALEPGLTAGLETQNDLAQTDWGDRTTYERAFIQVGALCDGNESARRLVFSRRVAAAAAALLEVDGVRLYHDQALYKEPARGDGGHTPWHVDQYYWPLASDRSITAWIPLVEVPAEMGPLTFASGSHHFEAGRHLEISDESEELCERALAGCGFARCEEPFALGDVSFHLGWTYHCAPPNRTDRVRKVMTVIFVDAAMRVAEPQNDNQRADLAKWFPGLAPGDLAASEINPVLWASGPEAP